MSGRIEPRADAGIVDENIDPAKPGPRRLGDLLGRGVAGQVGLDWEQIGRLALLTRARREGLERLTISIDAGDPDACRQQSRVIALPMPPAAPVRIATL